MPRQGMRSDGEEPGESRREDWRTDKHRPDKRSNSNTDTESPSKKMKSGPSSGNESPSKKMKSGPSSGNESPSKKMKSGPSSVNPDVAQWMKPCDDSPVVIEMAEDVKYVKNTVKAAYGEKGIGPCYTRYSPMAGEPSEYDLQRVGTWLPLSSKDELQQYDKLLENETFRLALFHRLKRMGGKTHRQTVQKIMSAIITPELAKSLSWTGRGNPGNAEIGSLKIMETVIDASRDSFKVKDIYTQDEINKWLSKCKRSKRSASRVNQTQ